MDLANINIVGSHGLYYIPTVSFNSRTGECIIAGESYLEDSEAFYNPIIEWLQEYISFNRPLKLCFDLYYYNTSSSKYIVDIMNIAYKYSERGGDVTVNWYYDIDTDSKEELEEVEDYIKETGLQINIIAKK